MIPPSFESVYEAWSSYVFSLAYRLCGNRVDAEDLAQESFVRVFRFLKNYKGGSLKGWLYKIVTNTFYLRVEKDKKGPFLPGDDQLMNRAADDSESDALQNLESRETAARVRQAIVALPPDYRVAVVLADLEEMNYQEIANVLDVPVGTVRSRISRGRNLLKKLLIEERRKN